MALKLGVYAYKSIFLYRDLKKDMKKHAAKEPCGKDDPYFAYIPGDGQNPPRKAIKGVPDYIPEKEGRALMRVRKMAYRLDLCLFELGSVRCGWTFIIGLIPAIGDVVNVILSAILAIHCSMNGAGKWYTFRMFLNILFGFILGIIPFFGAYADALFRANTINVRLFEKALERKYCRGKPNKKFPATVLIPIDKIDMVPDEETRALPSQSANHATPYDAHHSHDPHLEARRAYDENNIGNRSGISHPPAHPYHPSQQSYPQRQVSSANGPYLVSHCQASPTVPVYAPANVNDRHENIHRGGPGPHHSTQRPFGRDGNPSVIPPPVRGGRSHGPVPSEQKLGPRRSPWYRFWSRSEQDALSRIESGPTENGALTEPETPPPTYIPPVSHRQGHW